MILLARIFQKAYELNANETFDTRFIPYSHYFTKIAIIYCIHIVGAIYYIFLHYLRSETLLHFIQSTRFRKVSFASYSIKYVQNQMKDL